MTVIPDSIEPVEAWRAWRLLGGKLVSITNGVTWEPGQPLAATCELNDGAMRWTLVRGSRLTRAEAEARTREMNEQAQMFATFSPRPRRYMLAPTVEPPPGYGYAAVADTHDAPGANCTCGIYAASEHGNCPAGDIVGKVKLWGKVIPGEKGYRAEYAYPSELHVRPELLENEALLAYGVPLVEMSQEVAQRHGVTFNLFGNTASFSTALAQANQTFNWSIGEFSSAVARTRMPWQLKVGIAMNLAACAFNLLIAFKVIRV